MLPKITWEQSLHFRRTGNFIQIPFSCIITK